MRSNVHFNETLPSYFSQLDILLTESQSLKRPIGCHRVRHMICRRPQMTAEVEQMLVSISFNIRRRFLQGAHPLSVTASMKSSRLILSITNSYTPQSHKRHLNRGVASGESIILFRRPSALNAVAVAVAVQEAQTIARSAAIGTPYLYKPMATIITGLRFRLLVMVCGGPSYWMSKEDGSSERR